MNSALFLEIRKEYTEHLVDTLAPQIYDGLKTIYGVAVQTAQKTGKVECTLTIFQEYLQGIRDWSKSRIENETLRIKTASGTTQFLDDLVRAVVKANILLLCHSNQMSNDVARQFYEGLRTETLIHECYIQCGKEAYNQPFLFYMDPAAGKVDYMRNQLFVRRMIEEGIDRASRRIMPLGSILKEFLVNTSIFPEPVHVELVGVAPDRRLTPPLEDQKITRTPQFQPSPPRSARGAPHHSPRREKDDEALSQQINELIRMEAGKDRKSRIEDMMTIERLIQTPVQARSERSQPDRVSASGERARSRDSQPSRSPYDHEGVVGSSSRSRRPQRFDDLPTAEPSVHASEVSFSQGVLGSGSRVSGNDQTEKMDPKKIRVIERYGGSR